ncbi:MAG: inorganic pyrophosphatase [Acidobacteriota bacterium]|jgi:inorganic pyrophosphatase|nr:inorganic pyrophosphatase [Acidobacteriota bacterium]MDT7808418.1 inorganic pyrophosphatase [Acidobacteriota bacterium]
MTGTNLMSIDAFNDEEELNVVIETPKGSRNKYEYDERLRLFKLSGVLPSGASFPFDFGFVPSTIGGDGDPLDVLVLMDEAAFAGCLVRVRLVGVIEAEQTERDGETTRNDRLIGVASDSRLLGRVRTLESLGPDLLEEIEHFFVSYNQIKGKEFKPLGRFGAGRALQLVEEGMKRFRRSKRKRASSKTSGKKKR